MPGIAPAAKQQGCYLARLIRARLAGRPSPGPFRYRHQGSLATIGRRAAIIELGRFKLKGEPGLHEVVWDLRIGAGPQTRIAPPGKYRIILSVDDRELKTTALVERDPEYPDATPLVEMEEQFGEEEREGEEVH